MVTLRNNKKPKAQLSEAESSDTQYVRNLKGNLGPSEVKRVTFSTGLHSELSSDMEFTHGIAMQTEGKVLASMRTRKQVNRQDFERWVVEAFCSAKIMHWCRGSGLRPPRP